MTLLPSIVKGMRDYSALQVYRRNYILSTIRAIYMRYGFEPLETPALENRTTLTGKYGEEGEQLIFSVLKSGNFLAETEIESTDYKSVKPLISDKGLRYDLTIPLIRHIASNQNQITFPFRRHQTQAVWRADRPQRGRYREFLQCDADIIGSTSLLCEAEILKLIYDVFSTLQIQNFQIKINHRGILAAIADVEQQSEQEKVFCTLVDKIEKIGLEAVSIMLQKENFSTETIQNLHELLQFKGNNSQLLAQLEKTIGHTEKGSIAIVALKQILAYAHTLGLPNGELCCIDPALARGLAYYTGFVVETTVANTEVGSLGGGGRYSNLGDLFGVTGLFGVGCSFGIDRIYDVMEDQGLFDSVAAYTTEILLVNLSKQIEHQLISLLGTLRSHGLNVEIYPEHAKIKKQLSYADKKKIPFVIILGEDELAMNKYRLKNMKTGVQDIYNWTDLCSALGLKKEILPPRS
ncbi:histidine--tRNA ligase [Cardinium endosymbiont of Culicoides punctatus]|uniref:histidine--tRNA ligase n=1 Tax=Cardinium endosymbiont of Culicoides punctatus TaxID=2304601 RepID=UPI0010591DD4|nr:histidine--tRNA ligase [Cardinium endosymbiont of Culicoides punctatus]TDG93066.1 Histidine--tRNA ligase [Cardinium endosymbiont of Culicoides punctatus]